MSNKLYQSVLLKKGISPKLQGFWYLERALELFEPKVMIGDVYWQIADENNCKYVAVERAMRHAISKTGQKSTNGNFIATLWLEQQQTVINTCDECQDAAMEGNPILYQHFSNYTVGKSNFDDPKIAKFCPKCGREL